MRIANLVAFIILVLSGIITLIDGLFGVGIMLQLALTADIVAKIVYVLIGLSAVWLVFSAVYNKGLSFNVNAD